MRLVHPAEKERKEKRVIRRWCEGLDVCGVPLVEALERFCSAAARPCISALACGVEGADELLVLGVGRVGLSKHLMCYRSFGEAGHGARPDGRAQEARQVLVRTLDVFAVRHVCNGSGDFFLCRRNEG